MVRHEIGDTMLRWLVLSSLLARACGYASRMTGSSCGMSLSAGTAIMGVNAAASTSRTVSFFDSDGATVACGGEYTAGATYTVQLSATSSQYVFEVSGGTFDSGSCSSARVTSNGASLTAPTDGSDLAVWAGWASGCVHFVGFVVVPRGGPRARRANVHAARAAGRPRAP